MFKKITSNQWLAIKLVMVATAFIPIIITFIQMIVTGEDSVIFLDGFNPTLALLIFVYYIFLIVLMLGMGLVWIIKQISSILKMKEEQRKTELLHLKGQVNPHFFFNMLNNLYGLVPIDPDKAQELILKLSDLMRYSIYEGMKEEVTLTDEVAYLKNYIELHKLRYHKKIDIEFEENVKENHRIMPLLFIILLENAFKHGVENLREHAFVRVKIISDKTRIFFTVENNFDTSIKQEETGLGLKNLKRTLELVYPKKHKLITLVNENVYKTELILGLL